MRKICFLMLAVIMLISAFVIPASAEIVELYGVKSEESSWKQLDKINGIGSFSKTYGLFYKGEDCFASSISFSQLSHKDRKATMEPGICFKETLSVSTESYPVVVFEIVAAAKENYQSRINNFHDSKIYVSTDNGETWSENYVSVTYEDTEDLVDFLGDVDGFAYKGTSGNIASLVNPGEVITNIYYAPATSEELKVLTGDFNILEMNLLGYTGEDAAAATDTTAPVVPYQPLPAQPGDSGSSSVSTDTIIIIAAAAVVAIGAVVAVVVLKKKK